MPFTLIKLGLDFNFSENNWTNYYRLGNTRIVDAAVYWEPNGYKTIREGPHISMNPLVCLSFQFKKPLNLGRGGAILCSSKEDYINLKKLAYDGRYGDTAWKDQDITTIGYHYYMTPETAIEGLTKLPTAISNKEWNYNDYPYLPQFNVFRDR